MGGQRVAIALEAQAYCGPAHGRRWVLDDDRPPCVEKMLDDDAGGPPERYLLIVDPFTRAPARDQLGRLVYMPVRYQLPPATGRRATTTFRVAITTMTDRELVAELLRLEYVADSLPAVVAPRQGGVGLRLNPDLLSVLAEQGLIVEELRDRAPDDAPGAGAVNAAQ